MDGSLPLPTLLSQALVAFTIEFDNEAERLMQHRTTRHRLSSGTLRSPWLVSMAMWFNCMRFVGEAGITHSELESLAHTPTNLNGMERWGYISFGPDPLDPRPKPPRSRWVIRATPEGRNAQNVWRPLFGEIENRWQERFGRDEVARLRELLGKVVSQLEPDLPDCLPILGYGLRPPQPKRRKRGKPIAVADSVVAASDLALPALLSKVLLAFATEFEGESGLSLAIGANVLRLVGEEGVRVRDLPRLSAVSKEAIATSISFLVKRGYAQVKADASGSRAKLLVLTAKGQKAQSAYRQLLRDVEEGWEERFGRKTLRTLRESLERLVGEPTARRSPLLFGLKPAPNGWRAKIPKPEGLPHYPMVLHRGGYPDGS